MASLNNIYLTVETPPYKRYVKTIKSQVAGLRLNDEGKQASFILHTGPDFDYEQDVLEIYSDREHRYFLQANRTLIAKGLLKEYNGVKGEIDKTNLLTDDEIETIATTKSMPVLMKRLGELTSKVTVDRVLATATEIGRPQKFLEAIRQRATAVDNS